MLQTQKRGFSIELKGEINLVTSADQKAEALISSRLKKSFPEFDLLAEEGAGSPGRMNADALWVVDPLDGTTNFAHRLPIYAVSIALWEKGKPVLGVVYHPALDELFWAVKGKGAFLNKKRIAVSRTTDPNSALLSTGFPYDLRQSRENNLDYFEAFATRVRAIRRMGAAALDIAWTAAGRFDGFWELKLYPWDIAAALLMVSEAGGKLSDFEGGVLELATPNVVASNARLHTFILTVIEECRRKTLFAEGGETTIK
ncbi:MAG: inositol monophosphatase, partial [candidate division Zixibacteria bacterium]|nr:inositol monophosphatase [candidate division Zixibacteria bacterium]